ncbi:MAG: hypothetical protein ACI4AK_04395 [Lepagella sp.]
MKKFKERALKFALLALATMMLSVGFAACGDDDEDPSDPTGGDVPQVEDQFPRSAIGLYVVNPTADMLAVYDVFVTYFDNGEKVTKQITGKETIMGNALVLPGTLGYKVVTKLKEGVTYDKDVYDITASVQLCTYAVYDQYGKRIEALNVDNGSMDVGRTIKADKLSTLDNYTFYNSVYEIATDGSHKLLNDYAWD